jgi:hypothetical protein
MTFPPRQRRNAARTAVVVALVAGSLALVPGSSEAQDARAQRERVKAERAEVAGQVDALQADQAQITAALGAIEVNVAAQRTAATAAARVAEVSSAEAEPARRAAEASAAELAALRERLTRFAVSAYVDPPGEEFLRRLEASSASEDATRRALMSLRTGRDVDVIDQVRVTQRRLEDEMRRAEEARRAAEADRMAAESAVSSLATAQAEQEQFATQVRARLDQRLSDAAALASLDAGLSQRIMAEEAALAEALARMTPAAPAPSVPAPQPTGGGTSSPGTSPPPPPPPATSPPTTRPPAPRPGTPALRTVGGITVAASIADRLQSLLEAARADGLSLGGSGYRDTSAQIALRRQNCGTSDYAIWDMPPDQCSPPTARPGLSMHEQGLAVDFTANGRFISSRSDPGFVWLAANASRYGFYNLPSEPWHWSTSGG